MCPICKKDKISHHIEIWGIDIVEVRAICCENCLAFKQLNKKGVKENYYETI